MLKIFFDATDLTNELENYVDETATITMNDYLYIGYKKPINALYASMATANVGPENEGSLVVEYHNGTTWTAVNGLRDKTQQFTGDGFISWDRNLTDEAKTTVQSLEKYWYRISTIDLGSTAIVMNGLNLLLSDDIMIKEFEPHLLDADFYPTGYTSFLPFHQAARSEIIQRLRNEGKGVYDGTVFSDLNVFDLLDYTQLSNASKYYAIAQIYFNLSDSPDDKYYQKYLNYMTRYDQSYKTYFLSIDKNDDGLQSEAERESFRSGVIKFI